MSMMASPKNALHEAAEEENLPCAPVFQGAGRFCRLDLFQRRYRERSAIERPGRNGRNRLGQTVEGKKAGQLLRQAIGSFTPRLGDTMIAQACVLRRQVLARGHPVSNIPRLVMDRRGDRTPEEAVKPFLGTGIHESHWLLFHATPAVSD
ncbi:hypothetical protein [Gluconobacter morbifer]|nr:hypothetical protein [Gluconobacter morbifer]